MQLQAEESQVTIRSWNGGENLILPRIFRGNKALPTPWYLDFGLLASRTVKSKLLLFEATKSVVTHYSSPRKPTGKLYPHLIFVTRITTTIATIACISQSTRHHPGLKPQNAGLWLLLMGEDGVSQSQPCPLLGLTHTDCFDFHPHYKKKVSIMIHKHLCFLMLSQAPSC